MVVVAEVDDSALEENRRRLLHDFKEEVGKLERRYELPSKRLRSALNDGKLTETAEIAAWLFLLAAIALLRRERTTAARP